jgi:lipoate-protein ligase A
MGVDEALLASAIGSGTSTLRLYGWRGPWLSLGYSQRLSDERRAALAKAGVGVVRRATGGRAVLHGVDVTYAIAAPEAELPPGLRGSYELVGAALVEAFTGLGIAAQRAASRPSTEDTPFDCFARPAGDELCVAGRKIAGSAQRRVDGGVLQHGSIRLGPDPVPLRRLLGFDDSVTTSLAEEGYSGSAEDVARAVVDALSHHLEVVFHHRSLTAEERAIAARRASEPAARAPTIALRPGRGSSREHLADR